MAHIATRLIALTGILLSFATAAKAQVEDVEKIVLIHRATPTQKLATEMGVGAFTSNNNFVFFRPGPPIFDWPNPETDEIGHTIARKAFFKKLGEFYCQLQAMPNSDKDADQARDLAVDSIKYLYLRQYSCGHPQAGLDGGTNSLQIAG